jgi:glyoxylase-like metal-dependent hydrolase (beta-lactamase superfamily II)
MHLTLLGSGGDAPTPMPTCDRRVCEPARERGVPHARLGNSTFVHDANAVVDAPESLWAMLNREGVMDVDYIFVSHHHADHVGGLRVVQAIGRPDYPIADWENVDPATVVMSETTYDRLSSPRTRRRSSTSRKFPATSTCGSRSAGYSGRRPTVTPS